MALTIIRTHIQVIDEPILVIVASAGPYDFYVQTYSMLNNNHTYLQFDWRFSSERKAIDFFNEMIEAQT